MVDVSINFVAVLGNNNNSKNYIYKYKLFRINLPYNVRDSLWNNWYQGLLQRDIPDNKRRLRVCLVLTDDLYVDTLA